MGSTFGPLSQTNERHSDPLNLNEYVLAKPDTNRGSGPTVREIECPPMSPFTTQPMSFGEANSLPPSLASVTAPTPNIDQFTAPFGNGAHDAVSQMPTGLVNVSPRNTVQITDLEPIDIDPPATLGEGNNDAEPAQDTEKLGSTDTTAENGSGAAVDRGSVDSDLKMDDSTARTDSQGDQPPAWSEMKTKAGKERKRLPLACIACRRKKIRCSGEKPACKHCLRSRIPCLYKVTTRKAAPRTDYMAMLDKRLKGMEDRVIKMLPKEKPANGASVTARAVVKPALPGPSSRAAASKKRVAEEAFGANLDQWAKTTAPAKLKSQVSSGSDDLDQDSLTTDGAEHLPPKEIQQHLAEVYFDFIYGQAYPLLHKPTYMSQLGDGTLPPVLNLAVCAISARFSTHPKVMTEPCFLAGEQWAKPARDISLKYYEQPNITVLTTYLLLCLHEFGTFHGGRSWMFGGMAQRMAYALQLHKDLDRDPNARDDATAKFTGLEKEMRRRCMWSCFLMDRFCSSGTDRPMFINESFPGLQLPINEQLYNMTIDGATEDINGKVPAQTSETQGLAADAKSNLGISAYLIRIIAIWGKVIQYWNLGGRQQEAQPMWSSQSRYSQIRGQLLAFKTELPEGLLFNTENLQSHSAERVANQFLLLHMALNQVSLFLHRFALPSSAYAATYHNAATGKIQNPPRRFLTEAANAAIEAANEISLIAKDAWEHRLVPPFAAYVTFASSTVHVHRVFSKNAEIEAIARQNLACNIRYLNRMKKHWGMFHFTTEMLKDLYRQQSEAAVQGQSISTASNSISTASTSISNSISGMSTTDESIHRNSGVSTPLTSPPSNRSSIFQYGDWFDSYPRGISSSTFRKGSTDKKDDADDGGYKSDLQNVEEFFASLEMPSQTEQQKSLPGSDSDRNQPRRVQKRPKQTKTASSDSKLRKLSDETEGQVDTIMAQDSEPATSARRPSHSSSQQPMRQQPSLPPPAQKQSSASAIRQSHSRSRPTKRSSNTRPAEERPVFSNLPPRRSSLAPTPSPAMWTSPTEPTHQNIPLHTQLHPDLQIQAARRPSFQLQESFVMQRPVPNPIQPQQPGVFPSASPVSAHSQISSSSILPDDASHWNFDFNANNGMAPPTGTDHSILQADQAMLFTPFNVEPPQMRRESVPFIGVAGESPTAVDAGVGGPQMMGVDMSSLAHQYDHSLGAMPMSALDGLDLAAGLGHDALGHQRSMGGLDELNALSQSVPEMLPLPSDVDEMSGLKMETDHGPV